MAKFFLNKTGDYTVYSLKKISREKKIILWEPIYEQIIVTKYFLQHWIAWLMRIKAGDVRTVGLKHQMVDPFVFWIQNIYLLS